MALLRASDYERMLDLVVEVLETDAPESVWPLMAAHLREAFACDTVIFAELFLPRQSGRAEGWAPENLGDSVRDIVERRMRQRHPLIAYLEANQQRPVTMTQICEHWRHSLWRSEARRDFGTTHQMGLPMPGVPGAVRAVSLGRKGDFTDHELALATRIQPLLLSADKHIRELRRVREERERRSGVPALPHHDLTPRELTVLGLLAEGLTTEAIGRRLAISPHTVNRHLEKVYRKLGTNNRVSTVLLARGTGLVAG
ncbi:hypothetical protein BLA24_21140 [Streptomyces cinnamoneus]|uniref:HTH luxR-type domain-containing protein n=2 Tax=Streptomyces cinnamoneus TaxID=53446 RepID=A0A2G1XG34_STRCJ|nr:hypothetical protein BLA24_21140 [Streptomyces cinnamoneus]PPT13121.1 LuxR family transcriptional regulator [Streptomyces cinnamoneus]